MDIKLTPMIFKTQILPLEWYPCSYHVGWKSSMIMKGQEEDIFFIPRSSLIDNREVSNVFLLVKMACNRLHVGAFLLVDKKVIEPPKGSLPDSGICMMCDIAGGALILHMIFYTPWTVHNGSIGAKFQNPPQF